MLLSAVVSDAYFDLLLDCFFIQLYNLFGCGLPLPFEIVYRNFILPGVAIKPSRHTGGVKGQKIHFVQEDD